jgi:lipopolysaccharide transport protein LptA
MARSPFDHRCRRAAALGVLVLAWAGLFPAEAAELTGFLVIEKARNAQYTREGILTAEDVLLTHEGDIRITADHARHTPLEDGTRRLELTGRVHIEVRGAVLDADSATLNFRDQDLLTVAVKGSQATFSHQPEGYARRVNGRADTIDFDAARSEVTFAGNTSYTDGRNSLTSDLIVYGIESGAIRDDGDPKTRGRAIIRLGESLGRVPPPRQPERSTAQ